MNVIMSRRQRGRGMCVVSVFNTHEMFVCPFFHVTYRSRKSPASQTLPLHSELNISCLLLSGSFGSNMNDSDWSGSDWSWNTTRILGHFLLLVWRPLWKTKMSCFSLCHKFVLYLSMENVTVQETNKQPLVSITFRRVAVWWSWSQTLEERNCTQIWTGEQLIPINDDTKCYY